MSLLRFFPESFKERLRARAGAITPAARLATLRRAGFVPRQIVDAGAYRGDWATLARSVFPEAELFLVEPQPSMAGPLTACCARLGRARLASVALDRTPGEADFLLSDSNSYLVTGAMPPDRTIVRVPVATLAALVTSHGLHACDFLKLDVQGRELAVLEGAGEWFGRIEALQIEVSWLRIGPVPLVGEVFAACAGRGYVPYDIFGHNYRPLDGALWQTDVIFVRHDSPLVANQAWS